ncbi:NADP-dependent malic enzyme [Putridiphycobacter roseus]|uniref:NADP-dependent malic enzyme n=1 Tax=Putridiphycobacter roseus TaxID=2219161 RepID=A0A2W1MYY2_9FLAO|nr:NADP-dependent malic enzyme [Putridiphycobacter roseus]PZE17097.1 NADP-dependent malic enzyme [Putridiphycobacter roseus]
MAKLRKQEALDYHSNGRPGKIEVIPSKPYATQRDLSLAYSPGVAEPCLEIAENPENVYKYTAKSNLVGVISNGTAVLGLGDIGPEASKPVMEGKGLLFKIFADIDVFDIEVDTKDPQRFIDTVKAISPTFGGINLEDIKAPEAFEIEERLKAELNIPIMHDDQHGTAIISSAALLNALELAKKKIARVKIVISGAGAAALSCSKLYLALGAKPNNLFMFDSKGLLTTLRTGLDKYKTQFAIHKKDISLEEALKGADVFLGLSKGGIISKNMIKSMAKNPIVFALANPDPEISYNDAMSVRQDIIMATGRSDHPNQVNNVIGFPYIFRGALDVRATCINEEMKLAAVKAIASLAKEVVPEEVNEAYNEKNISFGRDSIIPKPIDPRLIYTVSPAVAKAAMDSGVAQNPIKDWDEYIAVLKNRLGLDNKILNILTDKALKNPKRVVFAEADNYKILKAAQMCLDEGFAVPILLGRKTKILELIAENNLELGDDIEIVDPKSLEMRDKCAEYGKLFFESRKRKGITEYEAIKLMRERNYFGAMMVNSGAADALISGITRNYKDVIRPALEAVGTDKKVLRLAGMYILITKRGPLFLADTTVNINPTAEEIADITYQVAKTVRRLKIQPRVALLSYSNFGSSDGEDSKKMAQARRILNEKHPSIIVDGEIQANFALNNELLLEKFPFSDLVNKNVNTLIFPNLASGNIAYKLMQEMGDDVEAIGPILLGLKKSVHVLQLGSSIREIVNMVKVAVIDAQIK